ncbi:hypothetical protein ACE6H2_007205 [Prunus campanulata]
MRACLGIRWPLFEHFGPILGDFEVGVYMPSSRTASAENELLGIYKMVLRSSLASLWIKCMMKYLSLKDSP